MIYYTKPDRLRADFAILRVLHEASSGLQPYTLLKRSKLSGEVFFKVFSTLVSKQLVIEHNSLISLSTIGRSVFLAGSGRVLPGSKSWRSVPMKMRGRKIEIDELYAPNINLLDS
ncbi:hypothetical protein [Pseudomonas brassicacearum]|jgi:hypothetical protein|uniref:hypothetical protein n=1 Tax=Pseudomonas brassicacearum TaxID=930166 RepID=UPI003ECD19C8